jgi:hypothetical protein
MSAPCTWPEKFELSICRLTLLIRSILIILLRLRMYVRCIITCLSNVQIIWSLSKVNEFWGSDIDRDRPNYSEGTLFQGQFVHLKCHMDWPGSESELLRREDGALQPEK